MIELLKKNLNINRPLSELLFVFYNESKTYFSVKELIEIRKKDRTTIQKLLVILLKKELITKRQINLDRGFMFQYKIVSKKNIHELLKNSIEENYKAELKKLRQHK